MILDGYKKEDWASSIDEPVRNLAEIIACNGTDREIKDRTFIMFRSSFISSAAAH
ncbi:MAG: hypothetical protein ABIK15_15020 [Pseudomonadota bacterium]